MNCFVPLLKDEKSHPGKDCWAGEFCVGFDDENIHGV